MTLTFDVSLDFQVMDWEENVTYYQRVSDGSFGTGQSIPYCLRREIFKPTMEDSDTDLITQTVDWEIWSVNTGFIPVRGDKLVDAESKSWIVEEVDYADKISRWRLHTRATNQGWRQ